MGPQQPSFEHAALAALQEFVARVQPGAKPATARVDAAAAEVLTWFDQAGLEALLLKGAALAVLLYGAPERRTYSDVDLLVAPDAADAAEEVLRSRGFVNASAVHGVDDVGGVVHAQSWVRSGTESADDPTVDLHRWLPGSGVAPELAWPALVARRIDIPLADREAPVLDRGGQAMHLAIHAAQHGPGYEKTIHELELALNVWPPEVWDSALMLARELEAVEPFAAGLRLLPSGSACASRLRLPPTGELDWKIRHASTRPRGTFHLDAFGEARSLTERAAVLRRSLLPRRAWIVHEQPWVRDRKLALPVAYALHIARAPAWAARAWKFRRRARRASGE